jgi:hypothetical protein
VFTLKYSNNIFMCRPTEPIVQTVTQTKTFLPVTAVMIPASTTANNTRHVHWGPEHVFAPVTAAQQALDAPGTLPYQLDTGCATSEVALDCCKATGSSCTLEDTLDHDGFILEISNRIFRYK